MDNIGSNEALIGNHSKLSETANDSLNKIAISPIAANKSFKIDLDFVLKKSTDENMD
jgi:hypothetical protein